MVYNLAAKVYDLPAIDNLFVSQLFWWTAGMTENRGKEI